MKKITNQKVIKKEKNSKKIAKNNRKENAEMSSKKATTINEDTRAIWDKVADEFSKIGMKTENEEDKLKKKMSNNNTVKIYKSGDIEIIKFDDTMRNRKFEKLVTKTQAQLKSYLKDYFTKEGKTVKEGKGWLFIDGTNPVMLTAHLDTVHKELPQQIVYENGMIYSPQGIGGDDRCGVYSIMRILKEIDCPVVFCEDEEIGGVGSEIFVTTKLFKDLKKSGKVQYVIDLDRKGNKDAVYYSLDNRDFEDFIEEKYWEGEWGSFTDICNICPELGVAGVNLSVGYYNQHTLSEYVVLSELEKTIEETKKLIKRTNPEAKFEYIEKHRSAYGWGGYYGWGSSYSDDYYKDNYSSWDLEQTYYYITYYGVSGEEVTFVKAVSEVEAIGQFLIDNPDMGYKDIIDFGLEEDYNFPKEDKYGYDSVTI